MKMNKFFVVVILVAVVAGIYSFKTKNGSQNKAGFTEVQPKYGTVKDIVSTTGLVEPQNRLEIIPPIGGRIEKIFVKEGDNVKTGETLAIMSSTDRAALLDAAQIQGPEKVKYWEEAYKPTSLLAPINGKVIVRSVEPGQTVNTNTAVLVLADRLIVKAQVDETDIGKVKIGQKVEITLDAYPDIKITGKVGHISYESETVNNVTIYEVDIIPEQVPAIFRSGMSANVNIIKQQKNDVLLIPEKAITYEDKQNTVLVKTSTPAGSRPRSVTIGLSQDGFVQVISGITASDTLLIKDNTTTTQQTKKSTSFFARPGSRRQK